MRRKIYSTVCFQKTVPPANCVLCNSVREYTEGTVFMTPAVDFKIIL